jgi:hypothetical protein
MKPLLILLGSFSFVAGYAQGHADVQPLKGKYNVMEPYYNPGLSALLNDSIKLPQQPMYKNNMPNAFTILLPAPKLAGNNGQGLNVYILPVDRMPLVKPDSTFTSRMPVAGRVPAMRGSN